MDDHYQRFLKELGERLKGMRKDRGWTYRSMVHKHKFHLSHWQGFEKGKGISLRSLLKVCEVFEISLEELVKGLASARTPSEVSAKKEDQPHLQDAGNPDEGELSKRQR